MITVRLGVVTAAQFLTLRLVVSVATKIICNDPDGPGHAPRYLDVSRITNDIISCSDYNRLLLDLPLDNNAPISQVMSARA